MIPRFQPPVGWPELLALLRPGGPRDILAFEAAFADAVGQRHAVTFPYGRTALVALLESLGFQRQSVVCPAYTCVVVAHAVVCSGNHPVFVDCGPDANMDLDRAAEAVARTGARMLIATSLFGHPVDLDAVARIGERFPDIFVLQDCAHSFTARWRGTAVQQGGTASLYGLNISKIMTSIFGGMLTTDDDALADSLRDWRRRRVTPAPAIASLRRRLYLAASVAAFQPVVYGLVDRLARSGWLGRFTDYYDEGSIELPADAFVGMTAVQARVGQVQARRLASIQNARIAYGRAYRDRLTAIPGLLFPPIPDGASFSHVVALVENRDLVVSRARKRGVGLGEVVEYAIPDMAAYSEMAGDRHFPLSRYFSRHAINLPVAGRFRSGRVDRVVATMREILTDQPPPRLPAGPSVAAQ